MDLVYGNGFRCFVTSVKVWVVFTMFDFALGSLMISWKSYLGSSVIVCIMKIKYMTLASVAKRSLCFLVLVMVLCDHAFVNCDCLSSDLELDVWKKHMVMLHSKCTYMKIKVKKVGFLTVLVTSSLCWFHWLRPLEGCWGSSTKGTYDLKVKLAPWKNDAGGVL